MRTIARVAVLFAALYLGALLTLQHGLPELISWNRNNCTGVSSIVCSGSDFVLSYWWLALLPCLVLGTVLLNWAIAGRRAA